MNSVIEFVVRFDEFVNVDLFRQGMYSVRGRFFYENDLDTSNAGREIDEKTGAVKEEKTFALPYNILSTNLDALPSKPTPSMRSLSTSPESSSASTSPTKNMSIPPFIDDRLQAFSTRSFRVQFCDQRESMNDACLFRLEVDASRRPPVFLELQLMFAEYNSKDEFARKAAPILDDYKLVATRLLILKDVYTQGIHWYTPVTFDDQHFALFHMVIHSTLIDFRFRPTLRSLSVKNQFGEQDVVFATITNLAQQLYDKGHRLPDGSYRPHTPGEMKRIADQNHAFYLKSLIHAYNQLAVAYAEFAGLQLPNTPFRIAPTGQFDMSLVKPLEFSSEVAVYQPRKSTTPTNEADGKVDRPPFRFPAVSNLSDRLGALTADSVANTITSDVATVAGSIFQLWSLFCTACVQTPAPITEYLRHKWDSRSKERAASCVFREVKAHKQLCEVAETDLAETHDRVAAVARKAPHIDAVSPLFVREQDAQSELENAVVFFDETYIEPSSLVAKKSNSLSVVESKEKAAEANRENVGTEANIDPQVSPKMQPHHNANADADADADANADADAGADVDTGTDTDAKVAVEADMPPSPTSPPVVEVRRSDDTEVDAHDIDEELSVTFTDHSLDREPVEVEPEARMQPSSSTTDLATDVADDLTPPSTPNPVTVKDTTSNNAVIDADIPAAADKKQTSKNRLREPILSRSQVELSYPGRHVFVLVHGYQGNSWDMRLFRNMLSMSFPHHVYLLSSCNQDDTECDIATLGQNLAEEVANFIHMNVSRHLGRLSFVAHSLGGLIVRSALACDELKPYLSKCYTFVTLATPHCGYLFSDNSILDTGMWLLKKWNKSVCLGQLSLTDTDNMEDSYVAKLSENNSLSHFRNVFLLSSLQDKYAPFHSARIELHDAAMSDPKRGPVFRKMAQNLQQSLENVIVKRLDISFVHRKRSVDTFIGRSAHIYFLDQRLYMRMLLMVYEQYFW
jgi:Putative serine esterase (DUF676)/Protein FAM135